MQSIEDLGKLKFWARLKEDLCTLTTAVLIAPISTVNVPITLPAFADAFASVATEFSWPTSRLCLAFSLIWSILTIIATVASLICRNASSVSALKFVVATSWLEQLCKVRTSLCITFQRKDWTHAAKKISTRRDQKLQDFHAKGFGIQISKSLDKKFLIKTQKYFR